MTNAGQFLFLNPFQQVREMRLLKVLDLSSFVVEYLSSATLKPLIHLKYLAVSPYEFHFHPESPLPNLETLLIGNYYPNSRLLPAIFWKMEKLRHVEITEAVFDLENNKQQGIFEESSKLESLRILRQVEFPIHEADRVDVLLGRCPNIQELDISFKCDERVDVLVPEICLQWESLTQLQILNLSFDCPIVLSVLHLPSNLNKLVLWEIPIESVISFIAELPSLEYLQLESPLFIESKEWCLLDITFHKLKFLKLSSLIISRLNASEESFPQLETLVIKWCYYLQEIPLTFADIPTLKQIKLIECEQQSLEASAVKIKKIVEDIEGCDRIDITIKDRLGNQKQL